MPTPLFAARLPAHHHELVRTIIEGLKAGDVTQNPMLAEVLRSVIADPARPLNDRLVRLESHVARLQADLNAFKAQVVLPPAGDADPVLLAFGEAVRNARLALGLSQRALATKVHVHDRTLRMLEKGRGGHPNTVGPIAAFLGLEMPPTMRSRP
jgi:phage-related baseplate assembly protein